MIIAFIGNDGSGKTTIAKETTNFFKELGFETLYKHEYEYTFISFLFKLMGKDELQKSRTEMLVERKKSLKYEIWPLLVWIDTYIGYLYFRLFKRGTMVILDRYAYDQYLSFRYLGNLRDFMDWLYLNFPRPDISIVLAANAETAYKRKKETHNYPLIFYKKQTEEYLSFARRLALPVIRTDEEIRKTISKVINTFISDRRISDRLIRHAFQNRIVFQMFKRYDIINTDQAFWKSHQNKIDKLVKTIELLKELLRNSGVEKYAIIKTLDDFDFVGNDVDVLISPSDFDRLYLEISANYNKYKIDRLNYNKIQDKGKMDVFAKDGLKIDVHAYVGWRNVMFFQFNEIEEFIKLKQVFGCECNSVDSKVNSILIALTHVYEKGYLTLDEYLFLQRHFDDAFLKNNFKKYSLLDDYTIWLKQFLICRPKKFPVFIPQSIILKSYVRLLSRPGNKIWKVKALLRDVPLILIWKIRYQINRKLPYEVGGISNGSFVKRSDNNKLESLT